MGEFGYAGEMRYFCIGKRGRIVKGECIRYEEIGY